MPGLRRGEQGDKMSQYKYRTRFSSAQEVSRELIGAYPEHGKNAEERHRYNSVRDLHERLYNAGISKFIIDYRFKKTVLPDTGAVYFHMLATIYTDVPINEMSIEMAYPVLMPETLP